MNEYIEVYRFECLYSKNKLNTERYAKALYLNLCPSYLHITHLKIYCYFVPFAVAAACVPVMLVGRGVGDAEGVGAAAGLARRLAIATRGAGAPRSLAAVLTRAPRSAPYRISSVLMGRGIDAEKPFNR